MSNTVATFHTLIKNRKKLPNRIRLYYLIQKNHYYINDGIMEQGFGILNIKNKTRVDRDFLLSVYGKMGFIFDELIRLLLIGHIHDEKSKRLLYILSIVPVNRKIRLFLDWKIFDAEFTRMLSRLFEVRNGLIHCVSIKELEYHKKITLQLSKKQDLKKFQSDLQSSWDTLLKVYQRELKKINWKEIISEIKN
jgi:hypothetical protein